MSNESLEDKVKRIDQDLQVQKQTLTDHTKFFDNEMKHVEKRFSDLEDNNREISQMIRTIPSHKCESSSRINDIKQSNIENERSIKKIYIWLSGIGLSFLLSSLTVGISTVRSADEVVHEVKRASEISEQNRQDIKNILLKSETEKEEELKRLRELVKKYSTDNGFYLSEESSESSK